MQTYNSIRGMTVCVSGGEYVNRKDAENKIAALKSALQNQMFCVGELKGYNAALREELTVTVGVLEQVQVERDGLKQRIGELEELQYVYENTPFAHWMERTKKAEAYKSDVENAKYKAFWDDSRLADRQQWERYDWPKHQKEDSQ